MYTDAKSQARLGEEQLKKGPNLVGIGQSINQGMDLKTKLGRGANTTTAMGNPVVEFYHLQWKNLPQFTLLLADGKPKRREPFYRTGRTQNESLGEQV